MGPLLAFAWGPQITNSAPDGKEMVMMTVASSYSLGSAPCPWGSGQKHAALADASLAPSPADSAAAPDDAPSLQVPAAVSWPGAPAGAEKHADFKSAYIAYWQIYF